MFLVSLQEIPRDFATSHDLENKQNEKRSTRIDIETEKAQTGWEILTLITIYVTNLVLKMGLGNLYLFKVHLVFHDIDRNALSG